MTAPDLLGLVVNLSLGLAGFAGVVVVVGEKPGQWNPADAIRIMLLLIPVFGAMFASIVPLGLMASGMSEAASIRVGSLTLLPFAFGFIVVARRIPTLPEHLRKLFDPRIRGFHLVLVISTITAQVLGIALVGIERPIGFLFLGLLWGLICGALGFLRLLFVRPGES